MIHSVPINKRYILRKYVMAKSATEAIKLDRKKQVDDCWVDEKWLDTVTSSIQEIKGFQK